MEQVLSLDHLPCATTLASIQLNNFSIYDGQSDVSELHAAIDESFYSQLFGSSEKEHIFTHVLLFASIMATVF